MTWSCSWALLPRSARITSTSTAWTTSAATPPPCSSAMSAREGIRPAAPATSRCRARLPRDTLAIERVTRIDLHGVTVRGSDIGVDISVAEVGSLGASTVARLLHDKTLCLRQAGRGAARRDRRSQRMHRRAGRARPGRQGGPAGAPGRRRRRDGHGERPDASDTLVTRRRQRRLRADGHRRRRPPQRRSRSHRARPSPTCCSSPPGSASASPAPSATHGACL